MSQDEKQPTDHELLLKIYESSEKTRRYILWMQILSVLKVIIIVVPIVIAIIYLPPLIKQATAPYKELMESAGNANNVLQSGGVQELMNAYLPR